MYEKKTYVQLSKTVAVGNGATQIDFRQSIPADRSG